MPSLFELLNQAQQSGAAPQQPAPESSVGDEFHAGLRSGALGIGANLEALAGDAGDAVGATDFAANRRKSMREFAGEAAQGGPRVAHVGDVHSLRDAVDFGAGLAGGMVPAGAAMVGGSLVGGALGGPVGAIAGGAAALTPIEAGDVAQRQQADPAAAQRGAGERLLRDVGVGGASAALQTAVPGAILGRIAGGVAGKVAGAGLRDAFEAAPILPRVAGEIAAGTGGMVGGEAAKQVGVNSDKPLDTDALTDTAITGALGIAPLAGLGAVASGAGRGVRATGSGVSRVAGATADAIKAGATKVADSRVGQAVGDAAGKVGDAASDMFDRAKAAAPGVMDAAGEKLAQAKTVVTDSLSDPLDSMRKARDFTAQRAREFWTKMSKGEDTLTPDEAAQPDQQTAQAAHDEQRVSAVHEAFSALMQDKSLTPDVRQKLMAAGQDLGDRVNQAVVASVKLARDSMQKISELGNTFAGDVMAKADVKQSADLSGFAQALKPEVLPLIQEVFPELKADAAKGFSDEAVNKVASAMRPIIDRARKSGADALTSSEIARVIDVFGNKAVDIIHATYRATGDTDVETRGKVFDALNAVDAYAKGSGKINDVMMQNLKPELQDALKTSDVRSDVEAVRAWLRKTADGAHSAAETRFMDSRMRAELEKRYDNVDAIFKAAEAEQHATRPRSQDDRLNGERPDHDGSDTYVDSEGEVQSEGRDPLVDRENLHNVETLYYGRKNAETGEHDGLTLHPQHEADPEKNQATAALERAKAANPEKKVRFLKAEELGMDHPSVRSKRNEIYHQLVASGMDKVDALEKAGEEVKKHGMVVAEGDKSDIALTREEFGRFAIAGDAKRSHYNTAARFDVEVGGQTRAYDAMRLVKTMGEKLPEYTQEDNTSARHRTARMFMEGIAAMTDRLHKPIDVPKETVLAYFDKTPFTWGDAKKLGFKTMKEPRPDFLEVLAQRAQELRDKAADRMAELQAKGRDPASDRVLAKLREDYADTVAKGKRLEAERADVADIKGNLDDMHSFNGGEHGGGDAAGRTRHTDSVDEEQKTYTGTDITKRYLKDRGASQRARDEKQTRASGAMEPDPFGNIHTNGADVAAQVTKEGKVFGGSDERAIHVNSDGSTRTQELKGAGMPDAATRWKNIDTSLRSKFERVVKANPSAPATAIARRGIELLDNARFLSQKDRERLEGMVNAKSLNSIASAINAMHERVKSLVDAREAAKENVPATAPVGPVEAVRKSKLKATAPSESVRRSPAPEVAGKEAPKAQAGSGSTEKQSLDQMRKGSMPDAIKQKVNGYLDKVLGNIKREFPDLATMAHAGEYDAAHDVIRVSAHALDPMTTAYHESLHAFFKRLMDQGNGKVADVLKRVATTEHVLAQMRELLKASPDAIKQLSDPEEAAAYMYQFHQAGALKGLVPEAKGMFERVARMIKKALGIWRDDERAQEIMRYFSEGEFKRDASEPNAVAKALLESGHNKIIQKAREMTQPLLDVAQAVAMGTGARLRASQSQAMREVADRIMRERHGKGADPGFIPAARHRRTLEMNRIAQELKDVSSEHMQEALEAMQSGQKAGLSPEALHVLNAVQGPDGVLPRMRAYLKAAGVDVSRFLPNPNYFPRVYDTDAISRNQEAFKDILKKYGIPDAEGIMNRITANEGNSFTVVDRPGMQYLKERKLGEIPDHELARFMRKDMMSIMSSYVSQATRRAEWARRFGDDNSGFEALLKQAKTEGASSKEIDTARNAMRAADGTLGDDMSPRMRRLQGNVLVYQNLRLLPLMLFSNAVDPMGIVVRGGTVKDAWGAYKRTFSEVRQAWKKEYKADADTKLAEMIGTIDDSSLAHAMSDVYMQGMVGDKGKAINSAFFRYNFTEATNRAMRVAGTKAAIAFIERHTKEPGAHSERYLAELGLKPGEWDGDLTKDANKAAVMRWVDGAVLRPETMDTPLWMSDPHYMMLAHLKRFVYAFQETVLKRVMHEMKHGNYTPAMALASYVPIMIAADAAKGMIMGGGSQPNWKEDWGPADYLASGVQRAGLLGVGQFALDAAQGNIGSLSGPTIEQLVLDPIKVAYGRESPRSYVENALPAHALYQGFVDPKEAKADPAFSD